MAGVRPLLAVVLVLLLTSIYCEKFGYNDRFTCHCADNTRCDRTTGACSSGGCEKGWSGPSCQRQNVALNKPAKQSSYYYPSYPGISDAVVSGYAVDGDFSHSEHLGLDYGKSKCVDMKGIGAGKVMGWWSVDLKETYRLNTIKIYHRDYYLYRFAGASVYIVNEYGVSTSCYNNTMEPTLSEFTIQCRGTGRHLNFTRPTGDHVLNLCEVEVYVCSDGTFGVNCSNFCHCEGNKRCDDVIGDCHGNCSPGWRGGSCNQKCYGHSCNKLCDDRHCLWPGTCDNETGHCEGECKAGWEGYDCTSACSQGKYGKDCNYSCNNRKCYGSSDCNPATGRCSGGCQNGWTGEDCTRECGYGFYGAGCTKKCSDRKCENPSNSCDPETGKCGNGCKPGWTGEDCTNVCGNEFYGAGCKKRCSDRKCEYPSYSCDVKTGKCGNGCKPGWTGDDCTNKCSDGYYGAGCKKKCIDRKCRNPSDRCGDPVTGKCRNGCKPGWTGNDCTIMCGYGFYGAGCKKRCSDRKCGYQSNRCGDPVTGKCWNGCKPGWTGDDCTNKCPEGSYGFNCLKSCSERHCKGSERCDPSTGKCEGGCQSGLQGEDCTRACPEGRFGDQCLGNCSKRHCKGSTSCNHQNGHCENGCLPGYKGNTCERECPEGSYGFNCHKSCSERHCKGSEKCDPSTGKCEGGCQSGWEGEECTRACPKGRFGDQCLGNCSKRHCNGSTSCNHKNGHCESGCLPGYKGDTCERECESGFYGEGCKSNCTDRKCLNMTSSCDHVTGQCSGGCKPEYYGMDCTVFKEMISTTSGFPVGVAVSIIIPVVVVFIVCLVVIVVFRRRKKNKSQPTPPTSGNRFNESRISSEIAPSTSAVQDEVSTRPNTYPDDFNIYVNADVQGHNRETQNSDYYNFTPVSKGAENFLKNFEKSILDIKNIGGFQQMFEDIPDDFTSSYSISQLPENRNKNRFKGYYPYDNTRVILEKQNGDPHSDFINASYIDVWENPKAYIAAQGATAITINDFVRMIWEQKCPKVVMLTNLYEMGKMKCERYWPETGNEQFGDILLTLEEEKVRADYTVRQIIMTKGKSCHRFYHFHYTSWPDHDVPNISDLLDFLYTVNISSPQSDQPQLVHCSAGVGRTGTYIAIDVGLKQEDTRGVDVIHIIEKMRDQRKGMIQTYAQLQCVHEALLEGLTYGNTCKKLTEFMSEYKTKSNNMVMGRLTLSSQYQDLVRFKAENEAKTRNVLIDGVVSTACLLPSRTSGRGMVLGELKDYDTEALWKIILHEQCSVVVCLLTEKSNIICPPLGKKETFGSLTLERKNEEILVKSLSMMTVSACLNTVGEEKSVKVFVLDMKNVKKVKSVTQQMKLLLDQVNIHDSCQFPVAVFSSDKDCGKLFCVLRNIAQRIQLDEEVDVFYNVRKLHQQGSSLIKSKEDYMEIYKFVSNYIKSNNIYENC